MFTKVHKTTWLPVLSGLILAITRMDIGIEFLAFVGFVPLFFWLAKDKQNLWRGSFLFSVCFNGVYLYWIAYVTFWGYLGIILFFVLYFTLIFFLIKKSWQKFPKLRLLSFLVFWLSLELFMNYTELAFPWMSLGYCLANYLYLIQLASWGGMSILSLGIITANYCVFSYIETKRHKYLWILFSLLLSWSCLGLYLYQSIKVKTTQQKIAILQPNIPLKLKHSVYGNARMLKVYNRQIASLRGDSIDLALLPESAIMDFPLHNKKMAKQIIDISQKLKGDIFLGFLDYRITPQRVEYTNSCSKVDTTGKIYQKYSKNILVPLGERVPFLDIFPFLWNLKLGQANWEYGKKTQSYRLGKHTYSPVICYEIAFPRHLRKLAKADFVINITNDAWFGRSIGTVQHMQMAIFRAIELRRSIYRCANTGYSCIVLPTGELLQKSELFEEDIIIDKLYLSDTDSLYSKMNYEWIFVVLALFFVAGILFKSQKLTKICSRL